MKRIAFIALLMLAPCFGQVGITSASEIALFGSNTRPVAYVAEDLTIYFWSGQPVAYLEPDQSEDFNVYGFNGRHLGWYSSGIVYDHSGHAVGARKEAFAGLVVFEPFKGFKQFVPFKAFRQFAPFRPFLTSTWSETYLDEFLLMGVE